jgi:hypothetical protein
VLISIYNEEEKRNVDTFCKSRIKQVANVRCVCVNEETSAMKKAGTHQYVKEKNSQVQRRK